VVGLALARIFYIQLRFFGVVPVLGQDTCADGRGRMLNRVLDLSPLSQLTELQELWLWETPVRDLQPLLSLVHLQKLFLSDTKVVDLTPLREMTGLTYLDISGTAVRDLKPLWQLSALRELVAMRTTLAASELAAVQPVIPHLRVRVQP
jgi:hypothetical protein